jgi:hypothetical protein
MVVGCQRNPIIHKIHVDVTENHKKSITLSDYTHFDWDRALLFNCPRSTIAGHRRDSLERLFHVDFEEIAPRSSYDFTYPLIFLKNDKVVHSEVNKEDYFPDEQRLFYNMECILLKPLSVRSQDIVEIPRNNCTFKAWIEGDYQWHHTILLKKMPI